MAGSRNAPLKVVTTSTGILFPHAAQAIQITRKTSKLQRNKWRTEVVYAVTSLTPKQATNADLTAFVRGHWRVENRLHWVRDVTSTRTAPKSAPTTAPVSWPPCATSPSASYD